MNERIKELAERSGFSLWSDEPEKPNGAIIDWSCWLCNYDRELELFAELIIQECIQICEEGSVSQMTSSGAANLIRISMGMNNENI